MSGKIIGRFYFKKTSNGNLIGEFSNRSGNRISTESADLEESDLEEKAEGDFSGIFQSTWQENGVAHFADLTIAKIANSKLFALDWRRNAVLIFEGQGMLCDNILIGDYRSV